MNQPMQAFLLRSARRMNQGDQREPGKSYQDRRIGGSFTARTSITALAILFSTILPAAHAADRPNILLICGDDHASYVYGAYGNEQVRTPHLDQLAAEGLRFDRAYCNSPVCTASRQSFLTGRYPRTIGVTQLSTPLPEAEITLADSLSAAGYRTAAIGKMHFNSQLQHGFEDLIDIPEYQRALAGRSRQPLPAEIEVLGPWRPFKDPATEWLNAAVLPYPATDANMLSTFLAGQAEQWLAARADEEVPFFLIVSFREPHSPFHFPVEFHDRHDPSNFTAPRVGPDDAPHIPAIFTELTPAEKQGIQAAYYSSVEFLDLNVGRVLSSLEQAGLAEETLVVYLGDHGYMLGQHGRIEKHCSYEPAVRAPLVMRYPERIPAGGTTAALVEFIDIAPTILDLAGVDIPVGVQGTSLRPLLTGETQEHREQIVVEYAENEEGMISDGRWKLVYITGNRQRQDGYATAKPVPGPIVRLYDLQEDPEERQNLARLPEQAERVEDLLRRLAEHMVRTSRLPDQIPDSKDPFVLLNHCLQPRDITSE